MAIAYHYHNLYNDKLSYYLLFISSIINLLIIFPPPLTYSLSDDQILIEFKKGLGDPLALDSWAPNTPPCPGKFSQRAWNGVLCFDGAVTGLRLQSMGLSGEINVEPLSNLPNLLIFSIENNLFSGPLPNLNRLSSVRAIYLSNNRFIGEIPDDFFVSMSALRKLWLDHNQFTGPIPSSLIQLRSLVELHLEYNHFSGEIPPLQQPPLQWFDLSNNNLQGEIPSSLSRADDSVFEGNDKLCGERLRKDCSQVGKLSSTMPSPTMPSPTSNNEPPKKKSDNSLLIGIIVVIVLLLVIIIILLATRRRNKDIPTTSPVKKEKNDKNSETSPFVGSASSESGTIPRGGGKKRVSGGVKVAEGAVGPWNNGSSPPRNNRSPKNNGSFSPRNNGSSSPWNNGGTQGGEKDSNGSSLPRNSGSFSPRNNGRTQGGEKDFNGSSSPRNNGRTQGGEDSNGSSLPRNNVSSSPWNNGRTQGGERDSTGDNGRTQGGEDSNGSSLTRNNAPFSPWNNGRTQGGEKDSNGSSLSRKNGSSSPRNNGSSSSWNNFRTQGGEDSNGSSSSRNNGRTQGGEKDSNGSSAPGNSGLISSMKSSVEAGVPGDVGDLTMINKGKGVFGMADLMRASAEVLGNGGMGSAYKAVLGNGVAVAVKRMKELNRLEKEEFEKVVKKLASLRHENVLPPLAYYFRKEEKLLVYEHVSKGSLHHLLHGERGLAHAELKWPVRLKIIKGVARGLHHLHKQLSTYQLPHGNLKSSNILINSQHEALLSDYGFYSLANPNVAIKSMFAYRSPEAVTYQVVSPKCDIYCLGVVILEILTGKFPCQYLSSTKTGTDVVQWTASAINEGRESGLLDPDMMSKGSRVEDGMVELLHVGVACTEANPDKRPNLDYIVGRIEKVKENGS